MTQTSNLLSGKTAVITGGTRGFGLSAALALAKAGAAVIVASRGAASVQEAVSQLRQAGAECDGFSVDVSDRQAVDDLAARAVQKYGGFDLWINNAGLSAPYGPTVYIDPSAFERVVGTNVLGNYYGSMAALRHFLPKGQGRLINILGRGDRNPTPMQNAYASSKAWLLSFTRSLAQEVAGSGVLVLGFNPGMMDTELLQRPQVVAGFEDKLKNLATVIRMWSKPPEVPAQHLVELASSSSIRNGQVIHEMSAFKMLAGTLEESLKRITGKPSRPVQVQAAPVPKAWIPPSEGKEPLA